MYLVIKPLASISSVLKTGDLMFYRRRKFSLKKLLPWLRDCFVSWWQHSPYIHVGLIEIKSGDTPWVIDMSTNGLREVLLADELADYDVDLYRLNRHTCKRWVYNMETGPERIAYDWVDSSFLIHHVKTHCKNKKFSYWSNFKTAIYQYFISDLLTNDEAYVKNINSATVVEDAFSAAGFDLCPRCSANTSTPDGLARSALVDYLFTITEE